VNNIAVHRTVDSVYLNFWYWYNVYQMYVL